uniref:Huntingtin interacting protein 1 n=1 Tax=Athene cunicularia TaxID=194338 RepID=A0A663MSW8_ATHCN
NKAINAQEVAVKEKHPPPCILGTHHEKGAQTFWSVVNRLPLSGNAVLCWKFCHVFHKLLRDGHSNVSAAGWGHLSEGYGQLCSIYLKLLRTKMEFHTKVSEGLLLWVMFVDVTDVAWHPLVLPEPNPTLLPTVFSSLDMSRSVSVTAAGQCRLAPLIQVILDCSHLYDYTVKLLFKLHSCLPADTLQGHRDRFLEQFRKILTNRAQSVSPPPPIHAPLPPQNPPNFLRASALSEHISPVVVIPAEASSPDSEPITDLETRPLPGCVPMAPAWLGVLRVYLVSLLPRDRLIEQLYREISALKEELENFKAESARGMVQLRGRSSELEAELAEQRHLKQQAQDESEFLRAELEELKKQREDTEKAQRSLTEIERRAQANEQRYSKLKEKYSELVQNHADLLRKVGSLKPLLASPLPAVPSQHWGSLSSLSAERDRLSQAAERHGEEMAALHAELQHLRDTLSHERESSKVELETLQTQLRDKESREQALQQRLAEEQFALLQGTAREAERMVRDALSRLEDPAHIGCTGSADYLLSRMLAASECVERLRDAHGKYLSNRAAVGSLLPCLALFAHLVSDTLLQGSATSHVAPMEPADRLLEMCRQCGSEAVSYLSALQDPGSVEGADCSLVMTCLSRISTIGEELRPRGLDVKQEELGDLVDKEMAATAAAIETAAARIEEMLSKARAGDTGVKLEVNERILGSCTGLMQAIHILVLASKDLQKEIVESGRGAASPKEFYAKNSRWTEGLISASKAVGWGATVMVDAADLVVQGKGTFEELMVCSREIAASTAQLVAASKVKADKDSANLCKLQQASRGVNQATASVVASTKAGKSQVEEKDSMDFSSMTLTQIKRQEMDSQVRVLELENQLQKERQKLGELRKKHYELAGVAEGWEEDGEWILVLCAPHSGGGRVPLATAGWGERSCGTTLGSEARVLAAATLGAEGGEEGVGQAVGQMLL